MPTQVSIKDVNKNFTPTNWKNYLKSTDKKLRADAERVAALIAAGQIDPNTGQPTPNAYGSASGSTLSVEQGRKNAEKTAATKARKKRIQAWKDYDEQKALNDQAELDNAPLPFPKLKPPAFPREVPQETTTTGTNTRDANRYAAQVPAGATGTTSAQTESSDQTFARVSGQTKSTTPAVKGKGTVSTTGGNGKTTAADKNGNGDTTLKPISDAEKKQALLDAANKYYIPESMFAENSELQTIFNDFVFGKNGKRDTPRTFLAKLQNSKFLIQYSQTARERLTAAAQYDRLLKEAGGNIEAVKNTKLAGLINGIVDSLKFEAQQMGVDKNITDQELWSIARDLYVNGQENSFYAKKAALRKFIRVGVDPKTGGTTLSGQAAADQTTIFTAMANNGFNQNDLTAVFSDLLPTALAKFPGSTPNDALSNYILQDVANGANIDDYTRKIRSVAGMGYNDSIRNLLAQGVDLKAIASPYIGAMASALEINPETITVNDSTIRSALSQDKTMNLFDFTRQLRKDDRWQYTKQARDEVYSSVLQVLRDFGFTG